MGAAEQITQEIFQVIEGGSNLGSTAEIIQFTTDNGQNTINAVQKTYHGGNGVAFNYYVYAAYAAIGEITYAASAGAAFLAMEVGTLGAFLAPALGLTTGYAMYNLTPEFWDDIADKLMNAGQTINGKVIAYMNSTGIISFHPDAIEIFKDALVETGIFDFNFEAPEYADTGEVQISTYMTGYNLLQYFEANVSYRLAYEPNVRENLLTICAQHANDLCIMNYYDGASGSYLGLSPCTLHFFSYSDVIELGTNVTDFIVQMYGRRDGTPGAVMYIEDIVTAAGIISTYVGTKTVGNSKFVSGLNALGEYPDPSALQDGAHYPDADYFPDLYPDWIPDEFPDIDDQQLPNTYPLQYPDILPTEEPYQDDSQNPNTEMPTLPDKVIETITDPDNDPTRETEDEEETAEDTDPEPDEDEWEDIDDPVYPDPGPDPVDPDPPIPPTPIPPIPPVPVPSTVNSSKLFTVYNPSSSALDQLGGYLWDNDLIDILKKIWQNPLDGIISLIQVYCTPTTGGSHNIILGYLDSGVSAPVVSSQFVTIDCGSVDIKERNKNCTDYIPYTSMELYLPFIGIVEIDTNEFMGGTISVKYKVDVYTGTCLAEVKCTRNSDMKNGAILYTYTGNCSQQIPLTSGDARGVLSALVGAAGAGLSIASGGSFGVMAGARMISANIGREMLHVSHSGNLSANAGIMGQKKPYVILNRDRPYNANSYSKFYGYPCNKTVFLANYFGLGFVRVKACRLRTKATQNEKDEILELLKEGVIL